MSKRNTTVPVTGDISIRIVEMLKAGDRQGLTLLYEHYSGALYRILMERLQQPELAQEALQDVLMKVWSNIGQYDPTKGRLFTWLVRITRNTAIDITRSRQFRKSDKTQTIPDYVYNDSNLSEEAQIEDAGLRNTLKMLSKEEQQIIDLLYFKGYTQKETSEALQMPLGTVKTRVRNAIKTLRKALGDESVLRLVLFLLKL